MSKFTRFAIKDNKDGTYEVLEAISKPYNLVMWVPVGGVFQSSQHALTWIKEAAKRPQPTIEFYDQVGEKWDS